MARKPHIVILVDVPGWAFDTGARAIAANLSGEFDFTVEYMQYLPDLSYPFDLIHVTNWGHMWHRKFVHDNRPVVREVSSFCWREPEYGSLSAEEFVAKYIHDATHVVVTSMMLQDALRPAVSSFYTPNGIDPELFSRRNERSGELKLGWAGSLRNKSKGLVDILVPAAGDRFKLQMQTGGCPHSEMGNFYNELDVLCVASVSEGEPLPLIEAMACGCFPVCTEVGLVPELVKHGENGLIVKRTPAAFRQAFEWCEANIGQVREQGARNAELIKKTRTWKIASKAWARVYRQALREHAGSA